MVWSPTLRHSQGRWSQTLRCSEGGGEPVMKRQHPPAVLDFCSKGSGGQLLCIDGEASEARECTLDFLFAVQRHQARRVGQMGLRQPGPPTSWNAKTFSGGGGSSTLDQRRLQGLSSSRARGAECNLQNQPTRARPRRAPRPRSPCRKARLFDGRRNSPFLSSSRSRPIDRRAEARSPTPQVHLRVRAVSSDRAYTTEVRGHVDK